jgi:uncharacterized damage-inducible protein DinB
MTPSSRWFDRTFELGQPDARWPGIIARLAATPGRIAALLEGIPGEALARRIDGKWSLLENVGHLHDLEALSALRLEDFERAAGTLHAADLENRATWDANHNARPPGAVLEGFRDARTRFVERLESMPDEVRFRSIVHPRLGQPMRVIDLAFFMAEHDDHHVARLGEIAAIVDTTPA